MSRVPNPRRTLTGEIRKTREQVRRGSNASPFFGTGMHPNGAGGMDSDNFEAGVSGFSFKDDGNAEFNQITLRDRIIGNAALTNPVQTAQGHDDASNFALSTSWTYPMSVTVPIPAGFTKALVQGIVGVSANNSTASDDYLYADISVPVYGGPLPGYAIGSGVIAPGAGDICWQATSFQLTGLTGSSFAVNGAVSTAFGSWAASSGNVANLDVTVTFTR